MDSIKINMLIEKKTMLYSLKTNDLVIMFKNKHNKISGKKTVVAFF